MKLIKILTLLSCLTIFTLVGCSSNDVALEKDYYVQIQGKAEKTNNEGQYVYNLNGYDKDGNEKIVSFFVEEMFEEGTILLVPRSYDGYTGEIKVIHEDELPKEIKKKFNF
ncbi:MULTISPECIES: YxeA family protein [Lysinibacillus]|uniref:YxeA family protein n=1 Tax=Lysinibacillus TaxID=400634 RepID=UPI00083C9540|nr:MULTISPECIES: YxeA family protein [Lysinibacillus]